MRQLFENNQLVDNSTIARLTSKLSHGTYGNYWTNTFRVIPMLNDLRSRSLPFSTPWLNETHPEHVRLPNLTYTDKNLDDILDQRAIEIYNTAVQDNKQVWIMWSGGIDSTTMLAAFIRTVSPIQLAERFTVVMSANSIAENYYFYKNFVQNTFNIVNWLDLDISERLLTDTIVLHGDPANALLSCPTVSVFAPLVKDGRHLLPFRENTGLIIDTLEQFSQRTKGSVMPGWAEWYVHKLTDAIPRYDNANSIAAFWWWNYVNFKWHGSIYRPFFFTRKSNQDPISDKTFKYYYQTCFYINDELQNWSYSNIDRIVETPFDYKPQMRDYIYSVSRDELYTKYKGFKASRRTDQQTVGFASNNIPLVYDQNWIGHAMTPEMFKTVNDLLNDYKG